MNEDSKNFIELITKTVNESSSTAKLEASLTTLFREKAKKENIMYYKSAFFFMTMDDQKIVENTINKVVKEIVVATIQ